MNEDLQRIAIAEFCGWTNIRKHFPYWSEPETYEFEGLKNIKFYTGIPDYLNDLNAIHEAEKLLKGEQTEQYSITLYTLRLNRGIPTHVRGWEALGMLHATAKERSEALLKVIGKYENPTEEVNGTIELESGALSA